MLAKKRISRIYEMRICGRENKLSLLELELVRIAKYSIASWLATESHVAYALTAAASYFV